MYKSVKLILKSKGVSHPLIADSFPVFPFRWVEWSNGRVSESQLRIRGFDAYPIPLQATLNKLVTTVRMSTQPPALGEMENEQ